MNLIIRRGTHEIGGSCVEITSGKSRIVLDLGVPLVSPGDKKARFEILSIRGKTPRQLLDEKILPQVPGLYANVQDAPPPQAVLISHAHQDHYGFLEYLNPEIPIYLGSKTEVLIEASSMFSHSNFNIRNFQRKPLKNKKPVQIGDFRVTPYLMDHSAFDAMAFLIEAEGKSIFYSGDFRAHGRKSKLFEDLISHPPAPVDALIMEGTTLGRSAEKFKTEQEIEIDIIYLVKKYKGLKLVMVSGQNIDRIVGLYRAALQTKSHLVVDLYTAYVLDSLKVSTLPHPASSWKNFRVLYTKPHARKLLNSEHKEFLKKCNPFEINFREIARSPGRFIVVYRETSKSKIELIKNFKDAVMIYSMYEGYKKDDSFKKVQAFLDKHEIALENAHTSGHASPADLNRLALALNPRRLIPIHTCEPEGYNEFGSFVDVLKDNEVFEIPKRS